jgi:short subunit dehydrogenase-like uncharacterized protein
MKRVLVFGATGFTGRLVVQALLDLGLREVVLGGRDRNKLQELSHAHGGLELAVADALQYDTLRAMVEGAHVVIDTAGPFNTFGEPVVRAAIAAGAHFLDTTGEQVYMARMLERYHGAAKEKGLAVINGHAFEFALGYCAAALLADWDPAIHTIDVFNRVFGFGASRGTKKSALEQITAPALVRKDRRLVELAPSFVPKRVIWPDGKRELAVPFPGGEALHLPHAHPQVANISTNLAMPAKMAVPMMVGWGARSLLRVLDKAGAFELVRRAIDAGPDGPAEDERLAAGFRVLARGRSDVSQRGVMVAGHDAYGITAVIAALGAKLLCERAPLATGVVSTDQAFGARTFLDALEPFGVTTTKHEL